MRITVRALAGMIVTAILLCWFGYQQLPSLLYYNGFPEAVLQWFPNSEYAKPAANEMAYEYFENTGLDSENYFFISPSGWGTSSSGQTVSAKQKEAAAEKLEQLLDQFGSGEMTADVRFRLAKLYFWTKQWDKAEALLRDFVISEGSESNWAGEQKAFLAVLDSRYKRSDSVPSVEGVLRIGGKPVPDAFVFLHEADSSGYHSQPFNEYPMAITDAEGTYRFYDLEPNRYEAGAGLLPEQIAGYVLAEQPSKTFEVRDGTTASHDIDFQPQIKVLAPTRHELIEGEEITFRWEPYEGAAYYKLSVTTPFRDENGKYAGGVTTQLSDRKYETPTASYSIGGPVEYNGSSDKSYEQDGSVILLTSGLLGKLHPGGEFIWSVDAYDADGRKLSSSAGYYLNEDAVAPLFRISEEGMLEGDRFILENKYEEAIVAYEKEGGNDRALRVLARLAEQGITREDGDPSKAFAYLKRLKEPTQNDLQEMVRLEQAAEKTQGSSPPAPTNQP
ncbi:tetratricopeptide repeat protein [Paenibacillus soyae]|uniref:Tetratricopeptide repeat protein n=1 Tax=Paenibacillus soyae TaxID=2969249 RepID=A0A9X2MTG1_9BACL|nr:tetratricopeptide repeat protein [Paenibacillus soyae]MCR2806681.1 tetratricopeptide repeat protein [Paenibacillus soyae]